MVLTASTVSTARSPSTADPAVRGPMFVKETLSFFVLVLFLFGSVDGHCIAILDSQVETKVQNLRQ